MKKIMFFYFLFNLLSFWVFAAMLLYFLNDNARLIFGVSLFGFVLTESRFSYNLNNIQREIKKLRKVIEKERDL